MKKYRGKILFCILSLVGTLIFFVPICDGQIPLVFLINSVKKLLTNVCQEIVLFFSVTLLISVILGKVFKIKIFQQRHQKDHPVEVIFYFISFISQALIHFDVKWEFLQNENVGGQVFSLAYSILITIIVSGFFVVFIVKSGIVEFLAYLVEPFMRKLFKLPGMAAIDCLSSFVSSASVGIYITNGFYEEKKYTEREACTVSTCFSVMSLGFMVVLTDMAGISQLTIAVIICSFIIMTVLAIICVRIPPLSKKRDVYIDKSSQIISDSAIKMSFKERVLFALTEGEKKAEQFEVKFLFDYLIDSVLFAQKVIAIMIPPMLIVMVIATYTPLFDYLGRVIAPLLVLMGLPNASEIAPATIIGIAEVTLPVISLIGLEIETKSVFFIVVLSIVQVIYFSESANVILSSSIPLYTKDLVKIFFIRTVIAIPLAALAAHFIGLL